MPMISTVGRNSLRVQVVIRAIYLLLMIGAVTMIYPFLLMLSYSVKSEADFIYASPIPGYLFNDEMLWVKYLESKYGLVPAEMAHFQPYGSYRKITLPAANDTDRAELFAEFRAQFDWPLTWYALGHLEYGQNQRKFRNLAKATYDLHGYSEAVGIGFKTWAQVFAPVQAPQERRESFPDDATHRLFNQVKAESAPPDRNIMNLDGFFWQTLLRTQWSTIAQYNAAHGTDYSAYQQVLLSALPPPEEQAQQRADWEEFVRYDLNLPFIRVSPQVEPHYQAFLETRYEGELNRLNELWGTQYPSFSRIPLPQGAVSSTREHLDFSEFLRDPQACPLDALRVFGPRQAFEQWLVETKGVSPDAVGDQALPMVQVDYADFQKMKGALRWEFFKRNYLVVLDYILLHGNGVRNTIIFCALALLAALTINPLAAYALSRYKPPSTYKILLFCMCTMAFPAEVTMIPAFLLLKKFPLFGLFLAVVIGILACTLIARLAPKLPDAIKGILGGAVGLGFGFFLAPRMLGDEAASVSLLNTFWALVLPGAANGFSIFLLKGFFDSLPQELYEAAEIDGGGEWTKFWTITMTLSKPILAVMALGAFTAAYGEFMMALVIIPDPEMWTLMVWLFQLQSQVKPWVGNAGLVIAAIPTFLIFLVCQNIILKGIVVPVEK